MKEKIEYALKQAASEIVKDGDTLYYEKATLSIPDNPEHGDFSTNLALQLTKAVGKNPRVIAEDIVKIVKDILKDDAEVEIAGPGFVNIKVNNKWFQSVILDIINNPKYFENNYGNNKTVMVEYISANPTGPLHIGHGRGAAYGDALCRLLKKSGYRVVGEYYLNDAGNQMKMLGLSVYSRLQEIENKDAVQDFPEDGYKGDYIKDIANNIYKDHPEVIKMDREESINFCRKYAVKEILDDIKKDLVDFNVGIDSWFSESSLYENHSIDNVLKYLEEKNETYELDGALWLKTENKGDDKDRVLRKSTGEYTYFTPDIAYHKNKFDRGNEILIDVLGADHHGYVKRMRCALECLGFDEKNFEVPLVQMVSLIKDGEKISMSTRGGSFIPLSWLINEVGRDAARFFYNMKSTDSQFEFNVDLAKTKGNENPVYYIQYAHARVHSLLSSAKEKGVEYKVGYGLDKILDDNAKNLVKKMINLKNVIETAAKNLEPHKISFSLLNLAGEFHSYYYDNKIINIDNVEETCGRLTLSEAVAKTIKEGLSILGVSAPERM